MFEDLVSNLLSTYLGDYLEGLTKNDLKISLWKGDVELRNLQVRTEALEFLNLPVQVKEGYVGKLTLKIPWKNLGKKPTKVCLDDVYLIACPKSELRYDEEKKRKREIENKRAQLRLIEENEQRYDEEMNAKQNNSSTAKLMAKIIDNFQLHVNHIHLRFEDHSSCKNRSFCAGILLEKLHIDSVNPDEEKAHSIPGVIDKKVKLSRFGIYWDSCTSTSIPTSPTTSFQQAMEVFFMKECPEKLRLYLPQHFLLKPIALELSIHIDIRKVELRKPSVEDAVQQTIQQLQWEVTTPIKKIMKCYLEIKQDGVRGRTKQEDWQLMHPRLVSKYSSFCSPQFISQAASFCELCWEIANTASPMIVIGGEMKEFLFQLDHQQYKDILEYLNSLSIQTLKAKYRQFHPESKDVVHHPREWWQFGIRSIIADNQRRRENSGWSEYLRFKKRREEYIELYKRKNSSKNALKKDPKALCRLQKLEDRFSLESILLFRKIALQEMAETTEKKSKKKSLFKKDSVFDLTEEKRKELFTEFDINPDEISPWEGGRPTDIHMTVDFHLNKIGLCLTKDSATILQCKLTGLDGRFFKRKEFIQLWCGIHNLSIEDNQQPFWRQVLYAEKCAVLDESSLTSFLPDDMLHDHSIPFLQLALELPALSKDADLSIQCTSLPLCFVGNPVSIMNAIDFFMQDFGSVNLHGFKSKHEERTDLQELKKIQRMKIKKEIKKHKLIAFDVFMGSVHLILPENVCHPIDQTQTLVLRLGDISVKSHPKRIDAEAVITEANVYDPIQVSVSSINVIITNYQSQWMRSDIQKQFHLCLLDNFTIQALVGMSIAPSEIQFANCKVDLAISYLTIRLNQKQYEGILIWLRGFIESVITVLNNNKERVNEITSAANRVMDRMLTKKKKSITPMEDEQKKAVMEYTAEELMILHYNRILELNAKLDGIRVRLNQTCNEDSIAELTIQSLTVNMQKRSFDLSIEVQLHSILVEDCIRGRQIHQKCFILGSKQLLKDGSFDSSKNHELVKVSLTFLKPNSPEYETSPSAISIEVAFGSLSLLAYRPTIFQITQFFISDEFENHAERSRLDVSFHTISYIKRITEQFLSRKKLLPKNWLRNKLMVSVSLQSTSLLLLTDQAESLYYGSVEGIGVTISICPAFIKIAGCLHNVFIHDCSKGAGLYPTVLCIEDANVNQDFIHFTVLLHTDIRYPQFPGFKLGITGEIRAPSIYLRRRCVDELMKYCLVGPLADTFALLKQLKLSKLENHNNPSIITSLYESAISLGKTMIIKDSTASKLPLLLPYVHVTISNCVIRVPCSSFSSDMAVFEMGKITVMNKPPQFIEEEDHYRIIFDSYRDTLNSVSLQLDNMCAYSVTSTSSQGLLGGLSCDVAVVVDHTVDIHGHLSKLSLSLNEQQILLLLHLVKGNLLETAVCCDGVVQVKKKDRAYTSRVVSTLQKERTLSVAVTVIFDGICIEYLRKDGGYPHSISGEEMYKQVGTHHHSFSYVDIRNLQGLIRIENDYLSLGASLTSVVIYDSRSHSTIHSDYHQPLTFGGDAKPAISTLLTIAKKKSDSFHELNDKGVSSILDVQLSIHIGNLKVLLTPWLFDLLSLGETTITTIQSELTSCIPKEPHKKESVKRPSLPDLLPNVVVDLRMDNPYVYFIEDTSVNTSPSFLISFSVDSSVSVTPLLNIHTAFSILNIRGCRANPAVAVLPEPDMFDAIHPFDINSNFHITDRFKSIKGTLSLSAVSIRAGIKDIRLLSNAFMNAVPQDYFQKQKQRQLSKSHKTAHRKSNETVTAFSHTIAFYISIHKLSVIIVDDTQNAEVPVLQIQIQETYSRMEMNPECMSCSLELKCMAEYYNPSLAVWEPVIESWNATALLKKQPRGRILQRLSASHDAKMNMKNAITFIEISTPTILNVNITSKFISVLLQTIQNFKDCSSTVQQQGDNYFISLCNCTGIDGLYQIQDDDNLNQLLFEQKNEMKETEDAFFSGLAQLILDENIETCWIELHTKQPIIRAFLSIPLSHQSTQFDYFGNHIQMDGPSVSPYELFSFLNQENQLMHVIVSGDKEKKVWADHISRIQLATDSQIELQHNDVDYSEKVFKGDGRLIVTSLPAHPSLALHYLNKPYRKSNDRLITIELEGFIPFFCNIDHISKQAIDVHSVKGGSIQLMLHSEIVSGLKKLVLSTTVKVVNRTHQPITCGFYETENTGEGTCLHPGDSLWCPAICIAGGLFIQGDEEKCLGMEYIYAEQGSGLMNIGMTENPRYLVVYEEVTEVPLKGLEETVKQYSIILSDVLEFRNLLPIAIEYLVIDEEYQVYHSGMIESGQSTIISSCKFKKNEGLRISIRFLNSFYEFSDYDSSIFSSTGNGICHLINKETQSVLLLKYTFYCNEYNAWCVQLFSDYWFINKTGEMVFIRDEVNQECICAVPSPPLSLQTISETDCSSEERLSPVLFGVENNENASIQMTLDDNCKWSSPFSINTHGITGQCSILTTDSNPREHVFAVSITRAPGIFGRTLIVSITPLIAVVNQMDIPVKIKQQGTYEKVVLSPHSYTSFSWTSAEKPHKMEIYLDCMNYGWSQPFSIRQGHFCLQLLSPFMGSSNTTPHEFTSIPDPVQQPASTIYVDITNTNSQFFIFIKNADPIKMPFCISNDCVLDCFTIRQRKASWITSLQIQPLSSQMWTLPEIEGEEIVDIYHQHIGSVMSASVIEPVLSVPLNSPGVLGTISVSNPPHKVRVRLIMQKTTRILVFERDSVSEGSSYTSLIQDKFHLNSISEEIDSSIHSLTLVTSDYFNSLSSSPTEVYSYIRLLYLFNAYRHNPMIASAYIEYSSESVSGFTEVRYDCLYFDSAFVIPVDQVVHFTLHLTVDSFESIKGVAVFDPSAFTLIENVYSVVVPFVTEEGKPLGSLFLHLFNTKFHPIAQFNYERSCLQTCYNRIQALLPRLVIEGKIQKSLSHRTQQVDHLKYERHVLRATKTGIYRDNASPMEEDSTDYDLTEQTHNFIVLFHSIHRLSDELLSAPLYAAIQVNQTRLRTPISTQYRSDSSLQKQLDVLVIVRSAVFGCVLTERANQLVVHQLERNSLADQAGVCVGSVLSFINGNSPPSTVQELNQLLNRGRGEKKLIFTSIQEGCQELVFDQELLFPVTSAAVQSFSIHLFKETEEDDVEIASQTISLREGEYLDSFFEVGDLVVSCETLWNSFSSSDDMMKLAISANVKGIGVSFITSKPREIAYFSVNNLSLTYGRFEEDKTFVECKVQTLQLDNQLLNSKHPVVVGSPIDISEQDWLHITAVFIQHPSVLFIEYLSVLLQEINVCLESHFLLELISFVKEIPFDILSNSDNYSFQTPLFIKPLLIPENAVNSTTLFAESLLLHPVLISLTCKMDPAHPVTGSILPDSPLLIPIQAIIDTIGTMLGNADHAQIKLNSFVTENLFISQYDLLSQLSSHYLKQILRQLYRIIGSVNFLGNPIGLIESLGAGVSAFFYEPIHGFVQGPQQFIGGISRGTKALLMNTSYGVLNTVSKIAGTFGDGVSSLTMSDEYQTNRAAGKTGILYGVKEGVVGVYKDTVNGAKKNGVLGAIAGTGKGMLGLLFKPVAGVFDDTTRVVDSIKEATQVGVTLYRMRYPRYIYSDGVLTPYCTYLAEGLQLFSQALFTNDRYFIHVPDSKGNYLMLTQHQIVLMSDDCSLLWSHDYSWFDYVNHEYNCIQLIRNESRTTVLVKNASVSSLVCQLIDMHRSHLSTKLPGLIRLLASHFGESLEETEPSEDSEEMQVHCQTPTVLEEMLPSSAVIMNVHQSSEFRKNVKIAKQYDEYEIEVRCEECRWIVYRRYSEFVFLHRQLMEIPGMDLVIGVKLPPKTILFQKKSVEIRMEGLNAYLRVLVETPELIELDCVQSFLKAEYLNFSEN